MKFEIGDIVEGMNMGPLWDGIRLKLKKVSLGDTVFGSITYAPQPNGDYTEGKFITFYKSKCRVVDAPTPYPEKAVKIFAEKGWGPHDI